MGIRTKIFSGFLILAVMLTIAGAWSIYELHTMGTSVQGLLDNNYKSISAAKTMIEALEREDSGVLLLLHGNGRQGWAILDSADKVFGQGFSIAKNNITIDGEEEYVEDIRSRYEMYKQVWSAQDEGNIRMRDLQWYSGEAHTKFQDVKKSVQALMNLNDRVMYQTASDLKQQAHRALMPGIVAILSALIFSVIFSYLIQYYIVSPILRMSRGIRDFLETGVVFDPKVESEDEIKNLAVSVKELVARQMSTGQ